MKKDTETSLAYADCFSGVSGDMFLGALLDAGLPLDILRDELSLLGLDDAFTIESQKKLYSSISGIAVTIVAKGSPESKTWKDIRSLIESSRLKQPVKVKSLKIFSCLAEAEAKIHDCSVEDVHFHEIGGLDSIIDIVGTVIGLDYFGTNNLITSPLPMPRGWTDCDHGKLPLPPPAVCDILKDVPVYGVNIKQELVTPTGAALVKTLSKDFGEYPSMKISHTGYGAGSRELPGNTPNLFRLIIGSEIKVEESQEVEVIETNLDDWSPELFPHLCELLFSLGALDVSLTPAHMKKGRPGFLLSVITDPSTSLEIKQSILSETTSIGLRFRREKRMTLPREPGSVKTEWGEVLVKKVDTPTGTVLYPEYEDCRRVALENKVPLKDVYRSVQSRPAKDFKKN